jgi:hypothetical protein
MYREESGLAGRAATVPSGHALAGTGWNRWICLHDLLGPAKAGLTDMSLVWIVCHSTRSLPALRLRSRLFARRCRSFQRRC